MGGLGVDPAPEFSEKASDGGPSMWVRTVFNYHVVLAGIHIACVDADVAFPADPRPVLFNPTTDISISRTGRGRSFVPDCMHKYRGRRGGLVPKKIVHESLWIPKMSAKFPSSEFCHRKLFDHRSGRTTRPRSSYAVLP